MIINNWSRFLSTTHISAPNSVLLYKLLLEYSFSWLHNGKSPPHNITNSTQVLLLPPNGMGWDVDLIIRWQEITHSENLNFKTKNLTRWYLVMLISAKVVSTSWRLITILRPFKATLTLNAILHLTGLKASKTNRKPVVCGSKAFISVLILRNARSTSGGEYCC